MKKTLTKLFTFYVLILPLGKAFSQVTIGSGEAPEMGALLQLKDGTTKTGAPLVNASKGLGMPRVKLTDLNNLYPMFEGTESDYATQKTAHTGLIVYNNNKCVDGGTGLYVWDGALWQQLGKNNNMPTLSQTYFDLPSGRDARGGVSTQNLIVTWSGTSSATWATSPELGGGVGLTKPNATSGTVGASPYTMQIEPTAMTINATSPWQSKQTKLAFTNLATDCEQQDYVTLNQTNYALKVNNSFNNSVTTYTTVASGSFPVQGNATWRTSLSDPNSILTTATDPVIGTVNGDNKKDGTTTTTAFNYTPSGGQKYYKADVTFSDTASVKRFDDITVTILNCSNVEPTMAQWAERAGFSSDDIASIPNTGGTLVDDNGDPVNNPHGVQLHKDQSGNIFFSGHFGYEDVPANTKERRWMITNLAATKYDTDIVSPPALSQSYTSSSYTDAYYGYPTQGVTNAGDATQYNARPRLGRLYNWPAATAGKNTSTVDQSNNGQTIQYQGICPNGWHLPSDLEWTQLEDVLKATPTDYSTNTTGANTAYTMKDVCEPNANTGQSFTIPDGGFNALLAGGASYGSANGYGSYGNFWSASSGSSSHAWGRYVGGGASQVNRSYNDRGDFFSVRCKK